MFNSMSYFVFKSFFVIICEIHSPFQDLVMHYVHFLYLNILNKYNL